MADSIISFIPDNDEAFKRGLERLARTTSDFKIPFTLIAGDWYKSNRIIFGLKSRGLYDPLGGINPTPEKTAKAEAAKKKRAGFVFPLLVGRNERIKNSLLSRNDSNAEFFVGRTTLIMGTNVTYAKFHQSDRPRTQLPQRKLIFISGGPAEKAKGSKITGRRERWLDIMNTYILDLIEDYNDG